MDNLIKRIGVISLAPSTESESYSKIEPIVRKLGRLEGMVMKYDKEQFNKEFFVDANGRVSFLGPLAKHGELSEHLLQVDDPKYISRDQRLRADDAEERFYAAIREQNKKFNGQ